MIIDRAYFENESPGFSKTLEQLQQIRLCKCLFGAIQIHLLKALRSVQLQHTDKMLLDTIHMLLHCGIEQVCSVGEVYVDGHVRQAPAAQLHLHARTLL